MKRAKTEVILELLEETDCLFFDGFDDAIIGIGKQHTGEVLVVYDRNKCIDILMERDEMPMEEAEEFFCFNTECAYVGPKTPMIVITQSDI